MTPESSPDPKDFAEIALKVAMDLIPVAAAPWIPSSTDLQWLKEQFRSDFEREINDLASYRKFEGPIQRLFRHVGTAAAFLAEAHQKDVSRPPGQITRDQLLLACKLVEVAICPKDRAVIFRRLCENVPFLRAPEVGRELAALARGHMERLDPR